MKCDIMHTYTHIHTYVHTYLDVKPAHAWLYTTTYRVSRLGCLEGREQLLSLLTAAQRICQISHFKKDSEILRIIYIIHFLQKSLYHVGRPLTRGVTLPCVFGSNVPIATTSTTSSQLLILLCCNIEELKWTALWMNAATTLLTTA